MSLLVKIFHKLKLPLRKKATRKGGNKSILLEASDIKYCRYDKEKDNACTSKLN